MRAPDSSGDLQPLDMDQMTVYFSKASGGIWFPEDVLGQLRKNDEPGLERLDKETATPAPVQLGVHPDESCPVDGSNLMRYHFQESFDVQMEQCLQCGGIWVSHTELDKLVAIRPGTSAPPIHRTALDPLTPPNLTPEAKSAIAELQVMTATAQARAYAFANFFSALNQFSRTGILF